LLQSFGVAHELQLNKQSLTCIKVIQERHKNNKQSYTWIKTIQENNTQRTRLKTLIKTILLE